MAKFALYVTLKAKPGKEKDVEAFLKQGAEMAKREAGTVNWYGLKEDEGHYSVFDTFNDEAGRDAHLNGEIAKALMANAATCFPRLRRFTRSIFLRRSRGYFDLSAAAWTSRKTRRRLPPRSLCMSSAV